MVAGFETEGDMGVGFDERGRDVLGWVGKLGDVEVLGSWSVKLMRESGKGKKPSRLGGDVVE